jgi:hypothetical protein
MQVLNKNIDMLCWFDEKGLPHPIRFRVKTEDESNEVIKIDKVLFVDKDKIKNHENLIFRCVSLFNGIKKVYELKFNLMSCKWILFRI